MRRFLVCGTLSNNDFTPIFQSISWSVALSLSLVARLSITVGRIRLSLSLCVCVGSLSGAAAVAAVATATVQRRDSKRSGPLVNNRLCGHCGGCFVGSTDRILGACLVRP